jgi:hypothetical protein
MANNKVSRYPTGGRDYSANQINQALRTLINDLDRITQTAGVGYNPGAFAPVRELIGGGRTFGTGSVGSVDVTISGSTNAADNGVYVNVDSGVTQNAYNIAQVVAALITDFKNRGMLG